MEKGHQDTNEYAETEESTVTIHENAQGSVDHNSDPENDTKDPLWRHGIDNKGEKKILRKLDIHILPLVSFLYLLSFL
jgi:hypothetical protein